MDLVLARLREVAPELPSDHATALASLWTRQSDLVIQRLLELTRLSGRVVWHSDARAEAIGDMARLLMFITEKVVEHRTNGRSVDSISVAEEEAALESPEAKERIENTARNLAEGVWFKVYDRLAVKYPLIQDETARPWPPTSRGRPRPQGDNATARNHYVPTFSTRPWANDERKVRLIKRARDGSATARARGYRAFGHERFLYPQRLEDWFAGIEQAAVTPYSKLLNTEVLTEEDKYYWVAFLTVQILRTPSFMAMSAKKLRRRAKAEGWPWAMTPALLRAAHQTVFEDHRIFASNYRQLVSRRWSIAVASSGSGFPRTDNPVIVRAAADGQGWRCFYPLTPTKCFVAGSAEANDVDPPAALPGQLSDAATQRLIRLLVSSSRRSFVVRCADDEREWLTVASDIPMRERLEGYRAWGELTL